MTADDPNDSLSLAVSGGMTRAAALLRVRWLFEDAGLDEAALDARVLTTEAFGIDAAELFARPEMPIDAEAASRLRGWTRRRLAREPVARILGAAEFWGLPFRLSPETLSPRPDTETLVEAALKLLPGRHAPLRVLDLGTGSGCLLVAILHERPNAFGIGLDKSLGALVTARANAVVNRVGNRSAFVAGDWAAALDGTFDLVVSNPPYIARNEIADLASEVSGHDPVAALDGGLDGLDGMRAVLAAVLCLLSGDGFGIVEIGHDQARSAVAMASSAGLVVGEVVSDLGGLPRAVVVRRVAA